MRSDQALGVDTERQEDGRSTRWDEHRRRKKKELTVAAVRAVRKLGPQVGMDEIAEIAGTSKTVYYRHFTDRAGLWSAVVDRTVDYIHRSIPLDNLNELELHQLVAELAQSYLTLVDQDPEIYEFVTTPPGPYATTGATDPVISLTSRIGQELADHMDDRGFGEKSSIWAQSIVGSIWAVADRWIFTGRELPKDTVVALITELFTSGLTQPTTPTAKELIMTTTATTNTPTDLGTQLRVALDGDFYHIKQDLRESLDATHLARPHDQSIEEARTWTINSLQTLFDAGFARIGMPEEYGGTGTLAESIAAFEILAMGDLSLTVKSGVQSGLFGGAILNLGNEEQKQKWLPGILSLDIPGAYGMTELGRGSDVQSVETTITYLPDSDEFEIHTPTESATKAYIGNAARDGQMAVVFGNLIVGEDNHGVHCVVVDIRDEAGNPMPGVTLTDHGVKGGLLGVDNGMMAFDHVRVPRANLLNRYGNVDEHGVYTSPIERRGQRFSTMLSTLVRGRISVGGAAASATRRGLTIAVRHGLVRTQFKKPTRQPVHIMEYQTHQRKLVPNLARAYAFGFAQNELMKNYQRVQDGDASDVEVRELETRAAGLKAIQTRWANDTLQICREACGGYGYMAENGLTTLVHDADVFATFEGDNTVLQLLVGRALLADFKASWSNLNLLDAARKSAGVISDRFLERTTAKAAIERLVAAANRMPGEEKVRAPGWHVELLDYREKRISEALGFRMREVLKLDKEEQFDGLNACQNHMVDAADAHMERIILEAFIAGTDVVDEGPARDLLTKLCQLYALATIQQHAAWYLERNVFDGVRSKQINLAVEQLSAELTEDIEAVVEGLGVPEELLNAAFIR